MPVQDPDRHVAEERLDRALQAGRIVAWEWDLETRHLTWSDNGMEVLGWTSAIAKDFDERVHPDDRERHQAALHRTFSEGVPYDVEIRFIKPDGTAIWIQDTGKVQTSRDGRRILSGVTIDITARKQAEAEAQEASAALKAALEHMDQGLVMFDALEKIRVYNQRALELLELPPDLLKNKPSFRAVREYQLDHGEFAHSDEAFRQWVASIGVRTERDLYERVRPNGTVLEIRTVPLPDGGAVRTYADVTARRQAEAALQASEERYRALIEAGVSIVWRADPDGQIIAAEGATDTVGDPAGENIGGSWLERVHPEDRPGLQTLWQSLRSSGQSGEIENRVRGPDGQYRWFHGRAVPLKNPDGSVREWVGTLTDISQRRELEERLRQSQKMEAVGQLTGGIAHDFNNLLTVILGNAEMLAEKVTDPGLQVLARMTEEAASRAAELTGKLLAFGRRQTLKAEPVALDEAVHGMVGLLKRTLGEHVEIRLATKKSRSAALTDRTLLETAVLNLAVNARDAMPKGGTLTISTGERTAGPDDGAIPAGQPVVFLAVSDTGVGMMPDVLGHAFEPFFTTKDVGQGTGLGLAMVYGFAQQSGGHVSIESWEGEGTSVTIVLRAVGKEDVQAPGEALTLPTRGGERVLVVEDEPSVRQFVEMQIKGLGYEVTSVTAGQEAMGLLEEGECFDLLFSDVVLPQGMSGVELSRLAATRCPGLKVLLTSGYPGDVFEQHGRPEEGTLLLRKPYRGKELAETLRKVLEG